MVPAGKRLGPRHGTTQVIGSDHLPVCLALPGLLNVAGHAALPALYSHTEGRLPPYDAEAAPVQRCLWAAVTAAQDDPSLAPWLGPAEQQAYGSMPAAAVDTVFEHLHAAHDALAHVVGRQQPSPDLPESGKRLQAAFLQRGRPNYVFSFDARKAFDTAPHGALHLILRHLSVPPEVIDLLLFLHTCARLRIVTAHGLTQPVHMLRGVRQGNPESPLLYALLLEPLLRAQGHRLRPPREAERGLIQPYIDDLLVVAHTLQHFVEGVEAVAAYLGMMGMELNPQKCAMATTEGVPGLQLRLCPHLENPWHWVPAADSVPYLGLKLQPDREFSLQRKHRLRLAAVHHWCLNTLPTPKVVQDVILAILGGVTQYVAPFIADDSDTARHLDHITGQVAKNRARYAFDASRDSLQDDWTLGLTRVPTRCQQAAVVLVGALVHHRSTSVRAEVTRMFWEIAGAHSMCPEVHYPVPEFATLAEGQLGPPHIPGPGRPGRGALQPHRVPQGSPRPTTVPTRQHRHAAHRQATTPRHVQPDGAAHDAVAWAPRATPPLPGQGRPVADSGTGVPPPVRR